MPIAFEKWLPQKDAVFKYSFGLFQVEALCLINVVSTQAGWIEWGYQKMNARHLRSKGMTQGVLDYLMWHHFGRVWIRVRTGRILLGGQFASCKERGLRSEEKIRKAVHIKNFLRIFLSLECRTFLLGHGRNLKKNPYLYPLFTTSTNCYLQKSK